MRKFYSLLLMLLCAVGAWAQTEQTVITEISSLSNEKIYVLKSGRTTTTQDYYLLYHTDAPGYLSSTYTGGHSMAYSSTTENFQFAIYKKNDLYYFYNIKAGKFVGNADANNTAIPLVDTPTNSIEIRKESTVTDYPFMFSTNGAGALNVADTRGCHGVVNWSGGYNVKTDAGNAYQIIEVADLSTELQNTISEKIDQGAVLIPARAAVAKASDTRVGVYTTAAVQTLSEKINAYDATPTTETFEAVETAYNSLVATGEKVTLSADEKFTLQCVETGRGYMIYSTVEGNGSEDYPNVAGSTWSWDPELTDEGVHKEWAIVEVDGSKFIYNVDRKRFLNPQNAVIGFTNFGYGVEVIDLNNGESAIKFTSNNKYVELSPGYKLNESVRTIGSIGGGAKFYIEKTGEKVTTELSTEMTNLHNEAFMEFWKEEQLKVLGYVGGYPKKLRDAINGITSYEQMKEFESNNSKIDFTAGGYYFLKTAANQQTTDGYMTYDGTACKAFPLATGEALSSKHVWKFDPIDREVGYKLKSCNLDKYLMSAAAGGASTITSTYAQGYKYTFDDQGYAQFIVKDGNEKVIRTEGSAGNRNVNFWNDHDLNATWYVIPAELDITIGDAGYASAYYSFPVKPSTGLEAYAITSAVGESATLVSKADIPANQGAILKGTAGTTYKLTAQEATSDWTGNKLTGTNEDAYVEADAYVLAVVKSNVGLYKAERNKNADGSDPGAGESGTCFKNNANKAYLPADEVGAGARFLTFDFDDNAETGINAVEIEEVAPANAAIYDLSGRRVQSAKSGLYIINGKKVIK